jgi:hypothetical protein
VRRREDRRRQRIGEVPPELLRFDPADWPQWPLVVVTSSTAAWEAGGVGVLEWNIAEAPVSDVVKGERRAFYRWSRARGEWAQEHGGWPTGDVITMIGEERDERRRLKAGRDGGVS